MKAFALVALLFASVPAHAAKWHCTGVAKFVSADGETRYQDIGLIAEPKDGSTFGATIILGTDYTLTGTIFMESPTRIEASGPAAPTGTQSNGTQEWVGTIDFQIQGSMLFGDVTFAVTVKDDAGNEVSRSAAHTYQACKRGP